MAQVHSGKACADVHHDYLCWFSTTLVMERLSQLICKIDLPPLLCNGQMCFILQFMSFMIAQVNHSFPWSHRGILSERRVFCVHLQSLTTHLCWQGSLINRHHVWERQRPPRGIDKGHLITLFFTVPRFYSLLLSGGDAMTTEMQEIAITEDKPLLTGQADAKVRRTCTPLMHAQM